MISWKKRKELQRNFSRTSQADKQVNDMFGTLEKKTPGNVLQEDFALYGDPAQPEKANLQEAITIAGDELLMGRVERREVQRQAEALYATQVFSSTHDLALSVAMNFYRQPGYIPCLDDGKIIALLKVIHWYQEGLVMQALLENFAKILCVLYEPER